MSVPASPIRTPRSVLLICLACMTLEGYDVIAYGAALPYMLAGKTLGIDVAQAGLLGSLTPIGMVTLVPTAKAQPRVRASAVTEASAT